MTISEKKRRIDWWLVAILILAAFLYGWNIWEATSANDYYTAAITSMIQSFHNFWYGAFDPAGFITVDKPPVALWFMAISAKFWCAWLVSRVTVHSLWDRVGCTTLCHDQAVLWPLVGTIGCASDDLNANCGGRFTDQQHGCHLGLLPPARGLSAAQSG